MEEEQVNFNKLVYQLEFNFIPTLVDMVNNQTMPFDILYERTPEWPEMITANLPDFPKKTDFKIRHKLWELSSGNQMIFYEFPITYTPPQAPYGIIYHDVANGKCFYYTLERSDMPGIFLLCSKTTTEHSILSAQRDDWHWDFIKRVFERHENTLVENEPVLASYADLP